MNPTTQSEREQVAWRTARAVFRSWSAGTRIAYWLEPEDFHSTLTLAVRDAIQVDHVPAHAYRAYVRRLVLGRLADQARREGYPRMVQSRLRREGFLPMPLRPPAWLDAVLPGGEFDGGDTIGDQVQGDAPDPEQEALRAADAAEVRRAVACLNPRAQALLQMIFWQELPWVEIGRNLRVTADHVAVLRRLALRRLRAILAEVTP